MKPIVFAGSMLLASSSVLGSGCGPKLDDPKPEPTTAKAPDTALPQGRRRPRRSDLAAAAAAPPSNPDPLSGRFSLEDATEGLAAKGDLVATIDTDLGTLECRLFEQQAPINVANFVGLARGLRPFWSGTEWTKRPAFDGTLFHRIMKGFMIQGGTRTADEEAGYVIPDENTGALHDRPGQLCMANRGKDTASRQFFITDGAASHLDGGFTIFGECEPIELVHKLASVPVNGETPRTAVGVRHVEVSRVAPSAPSTSASASASAAPTVPPSAKPRASAARQ